MPSCGPDSQRRDEAARTCVVATFIGLDLAWKATNESGICWLEGESPETLRCTRIEAAVQSTEDLADEIASVDGTVIVTIDAPVLCSPYTDHPLSAAQSDGEAAHNSSVLRTRRRWVDPEIGWRFWQYKEFAYPASAAVANGWTTGIELGRALQARGFALDLEMRRGGGHRRVAVEVYLHTIHVRLFELDERLPYKKGRVADRRQAMQLYQQHLREIAEREVPGILDNARLQDALASETAEMARGKALKRLEDTLDGLTCALAAWLAWRTPDGWEMIGDLNGYILVPRAAGGEVASGGSITDRSARHLSVGAPPCRLRCSL